MRGQIDTLNLTNTTVTTNNKQMIKREPIYDHITIKEKSNYSTSRLCLKHISIYKST